MKQSWVPAIVVLLPAVLVAFAPAAAAEEWKIEDDTGDVSPVNDGVVGVPANPVADLADIRNVRVVKETGIELTLAYELVSTHFEVPAGGRVVLKHLICFKTGGTPLAVRLTYELGESGNPRQVSPMLLRLPNETCNLDYVPTSGAGTAIKAVLNGDENTFHIVVPKRSLGSLIGDPYGIARGSQIEGVRAFSRALQLAYVPPTSYYAFADVAPNTGPGNNPFVFALPTHNLDLRVELPQAPTKGVLQCSGLDRPVVSVEGGRYTGIPLTLQSDLPNPVLTQLTATAAKNGWEAKLIPKLVVPETQDGNPGNTTVTLIVKSGQAASKDCSEVRVLATDSENPDRSGEVVIDVVSSPALSKDRRTLYLHQRSPDKETQLPPLLWLNAAQEDVFADPNAFTRMEPSEGTQVFSSNPFQVRAQSDAANPFDVLLDTSKPAKVHLFFNSEYLPSNAKFKVELTAGDEILAYGEGPGSIPASGGTVDLDLVVEPDVFKNPLRRAPADAPFALTIRYEPTKLNSALPGVGQGRVSLVPGKSSLDLPIADTILTRDVRLGEKGGLVSLTLKDPEASKLANEGRVVSFQFLMRNEGIGTGSFDVSTNWTADPPANWTVLIKGGKTRYDNLAPGDAALFEVQVIAPPTAPEGAEARVRILVDGLEDEASATALVTVKVAKQQEHGQVYEAPPPVKKNTPGFELVLLLAVLALLGARRRRPNG